ncbi:hypothetical protein F9C07_3790 [Aspergillus flavus]|uniref:Uncharacterized protein n=2 Tax=Aspergillus flavus TaxID=5059 RepID=B8N6E1_ASPFN|nr:uncharacterized protein G4B84_006452 [Aspergillus flavus NRRL3357]QRD89995.1 hypothetical protein F9C07_3790 [Aspergillus flavus]KAF7625512.1 hypothetical protein AFLA_002372 [Aspergillus flavus NRRL3357]QMW31071.1 hypothetical protein G4B84_006452 [Aspergillus flavus NRRL3357]RAQ74870.1 hypothetical protein COH21_006240 [Aspergillus flavus]RAQ76118.1 hypothetical protein COH20_001556 [Aspergillus flavus]
MDSRVQIPGNSNNHANNNMSTAQQALLTTSPQPHNPLSLASKQPIPTSGASIHERSASHHPHTQPTEYSQQQLSQLPEASGQQPNALESYPHQVSGSGGPTATAPFLRDFSLVAEAAKRAQMSVVMRDLEAVTL